MKKAPETRKISLGATFAIVAVAALCLIVSNSALWFNRYVFNTQNFTTITTNSLLSESSRNAIAGEVVDKALQNRPVLKSALDDRATKLVSALLDTNAFRSVVTRAVTTLQTTVTSNNPQPVAIDLTGIKATVSNVVGVARDVTNRPVPEDQQVSINDVPDQIVLLDPANLPNIYRIGVALTWIGIASFVLAVVLLALPLYRAAKNNPASVWNVAGIEGLVLIAAGLLALIIGPLFKPPVLANVQSANARVAVENLYDAFIGKFNSQTMSLMVVTGVILCLVSLWPHGLRAVKQLSKKR